MREEPSVLAYLQTDHRRLDLLMERCQESMRSGEIETAAGTFREFRQGLLRHIKIEEGLLFPEFEAATGMSRVGGPTGVMRQEHEEIIRLLGMIQKLFDEPGADTGRFEKLRSTLVATLSQHNAKEEMVIY